ncbi:GNAT family N-acetyltransferase [Jeotgalicoccus nanhaiensis]|uniref:GNAT family N-acetyltransferase n=1 Tax=Jeotgalicoccus nanhaiensis TaxID=568603 RepID=A0ABR9XW44_9STAP|nr:GNAT family N-acetyltransferase [Jeotgalicoccus nanhaiensis]MBF0753063.1 GNAT family N-acetyltransferase [Jeotgalicoccus nanhaiensis]TFU63213.1 GNAT family N-acetyltransferase [Jeotgalicoccus nanhaiensis]
MTCIRIKEIDASNINEMRRISVKEHQKSFIETVDECLEEAAIYKQWCPVAIYDYDKIVGFAMYGAFGKNPDTWIDRIIIDEKYQGKGFGKLAMKELIKIITEKYNVNIVYLSFVENNDVARKLYENLGFNFTDEYDPEGELIYKFNLTENFK